MEGYDEIIIPELKEKYLKVKYILKEQIKTDPENEPYKSKYEALQILNEMSSILTERLNVEPQTVNLNDLLAVVYCYISSLSYDVEETNTGNEMAIKSLDLIPSPIHPARITCSMTCLNNLGFSSCQNEKYKEAQELLEKAEGYYIQYNNEILEKPMEFDFMFTGNCNAECENSFEKCHTQTLFYLAQVYSKLKDPAKSARYCHNTLKRQLETRDEDKVEWALNAATLSQFLIEQNAFKEARHHLAASTIVLQKHNFELEQLLIKDPENEELKAKLETGRHRIADIYRCWAKYSIFLLNGSKDRLLSSEGDKVDPPPQPPEELKGLQFTSLKEELKDLEKSVTADFILTYEDSKPLFQKSQDWLNSAKEYYTLEDHASEHAAIIQDSSKLYHLLSFFQPDETIQSKLHKRRIDMLCGVVNALNAKYYMKVCRELWFEIGETCMTMADIKATQAKESKESSSNANLQHYVSKVKQLLQQGIKYLEEFVQSFKLSNNEKYPEEFEKNIILAYMYLGHMYARVNDSDKTVVIKSQEKSLDCYVAILDYCAEHPDKKQLYAEEYSICHEMFELIPLKISRLKSLYNSA